jgi:mono/diheme cytochrome c family protein
MRRAALAGAAALALATAERSPAAAPGGAELYVEHCQACHQPRGQGAPGFAPPLVSPLWQRVSRGAPRSYLPLVVLNGLSGRLEVGGQVYDSAMPPQAGLDDAAIAAIANYVLRDLSRRRREDIAPVQAAEVAALRAQAPTAADLLQLRGQIAP